MNNIPYRKIRNFLLLLVLLMIIASAFPAYVFLKDSEWYSLEEIIQKQQSGEDFLFGPAYSNPNEYFKLLSLSAKPYDVIAFGSCRALQFRSNFFTNASFFNAGHAILFLNQTIPFLERIPTEHLPKTMILVLTQNFFNDNWVEPAFQYHLEPYDLYDYLSFFRANFLTIYQDYLLNGKFTISSLYSNQSKFGLNALVNNNGYRSDGSYLFGAEIRKRAEGVPLDFQETFERIDSGVMSFQYGAEVSTKALSSLDQILDFASEHDIYVIGVLPPYPHAIWEKLVNKSDDYQYLFKLQDSINPLFLKYDYELYDFSDMGKLSADDCESIDGSHASDKAYLRMTLVMAKSDNLLKRYVDIPQLEDYLNQTEECFLE